MTHITINLANEAVEINEVSSAERGISREKSGHFTQFCYAAPCRFVCRINGYQQFHDTEMKFKNSHISLPDCRSIRAPGRRFIIVLRK